jgi:hypothetical protein
VTPGNRIAACSARAEQGEGEWCCDSFHVC